MTILFIDPLVTAGGYPLPVLEFNPVQRTSFLAHYRDSPPCVVLANFILDIKVRSSYACLI